MNSSLSHFKATLQRRKERTEKTKGRFRKNKENFLKASNAKSEFSFPKPSRHKLAILKEEIKQKSILRKRKELLIFVMIMVTLFTLFFLLK